MSLSEKELQSLIANTEENISRLEKSHENGIKKIEIDLTNLDLSKLSDKERAKFTTRKEKLIKRMHKVFKKALADLNFLRYQLQVRLAKKT